MELAFQKVKCSTELIAYILTETINPCTDLAKLESGIPFDKICDIIGYVWC